MATTALIPVSEYLSTTYRPDRDYIDGGLQERNVGERPHGTMQTAIAGIVNANRKAWHAVAITEQRLQISASRFRIPDVCVLRRSDPVENIVRSAPLACVEVLSPSDTLSSLQERIDDYLQLGVTNIWLIDPYRRRALVASRQGLQEPAEAAFSAAGTPIRISMEELFAEFDDLLTQF